MLQLKESTSADTRSRKADFLELSAFLSERGTASAADLVGSLAVADDIAVEAMLFDEETGEELDAAILDEGRQELTQDVFEELAYRSECLGTAYPFHVDYRSSLVTYSGDHILDSDWGLTYVFCLLASAIRDRAFDVSLAQQSNLDTLERSIGVNFQACACLAAGAYLSGPVASFGFPRADGTGFLPALRLAYERFGSGSVRLREDEIVDDLPNSLKDGGIDVIAWRELPDRMPGKLYMLGQCASGSNWKGKSVVEYISQLHGSWFTMAPAHHTIPAMFIPFPFHHDIDEPKSGPFKQRIRTRFWHEEQKFGIIFDRLRITHLVESFGTVSDNTKSQIDGRTEMARLREWVNSFSRFSRGWAEAA